MIRMAVYVEWCNMWESQGDLTLQGSSADTRLATAILACTPYWPN